MSWMEITTVIGCKNACAYCPQEIFLKAYKERSAVLRMGFDVFKVCVDKIPPDVEVVFSGFSEPWLNPECTKMVLYAHKKGHKVSAYTTLAGMGEGDVDLLEEVPFRHFDVHLPSAEGYEKTKVNDDYLRVLRKINHSGIKKAYFIHFGSIHPEIKPLLKAKDIRRHYTHTRAGNLEFRSMLPPKRKHGHIGCTRNLSYNVLLPNGDVVLCCMDYGMQHVLGNLLSCEYNSLFSSEEFLKVKKGLRDESLDILCRYCDKFAYDASLYAKVYNRYFCKLEDVHNLKDLRHLTLKAVSKFKKHD